MRLIDADALKADYYEEYEAKDDEYVYRYYSEGQIDKAPTIDAVSVVRCKECKHASDNKVYGCSLIDFNTDDYHRMYADDYCSYGERSTND